MIKTKSVGYETQSIIDCSSSAFTIVVLPKPAEAFPFKRNCASMQSYFNSLKWNPLVKFEGFGVGRNAYYTISKF